jgi:benzoylformate decarboxylase
MLGRDVFFDSLKAHGVTRMFGNPGTTESPLLDHLPDHPELEYIVALYEAVAVGAASFYAQATGKTGIVSLHVAPGLGNGLGMIFNGLKANAPMIITAGQQDTRMLLRGPVLSHDLAAMAAPVTKWSTQVQTADDMADIMRRAFKIANDPPFGPVFVALPINVMEQQTKNAATTAGPLFRAPRPDADALAQMAAMLSAARSPAIVAGDDIARAGATDALLALAEKLGAAVWVEGIRAQMPLPNRHPMMRGVLPLERKHIAATLSEYDCVLLLGGPFFEEVWFDDASPFPAGLKVLQIEESAAQLARDNSLTLGAVGGMKPALAELVATVSPDSAAAKARCAALAESKSKERSSQIARAERASARRPMAVSLAMETLGAALPADAVVVEEAITAAPDLNRSVNLPGPGSYYAGRGGGIGQGLAGAIGVAVGKPDKQVVCVSGDGSAMYSIQALWTAAHHNLNIVFVILSNTEYRILKHNIDNYRNRFSVESNRGYTHMDLAGPDLGFVEMARGMGVQAEAVGEPEQFTAALERAFAADGPSLIQVAIEGKA